MSELTAPSPPPGFFEPCEPEGILTRSVAYFEDHTHVLPASMATTADTVLANCHAIREYFYRAPNCIVCTSEVLARIKALVPGTARIAAENFLAGLPLHVVPTRTEAIVLAEDMQRQGKRVLLALGDVT